MNEWYESDFELSNGTKFSIVHNIPGTGPVNSISAAFQIWLLKTDTYTAESLCDYINSKGIYTAMTMEKYKSIKKRKI